MDLGAEVSPGDRPADVRLARRRRFEQLAVRQAGVVSRDQLLAAGLTHHELDANVVAGRWQTVGRESICIHTGPLPILAAHWAVVFEGGPRAFLDGESSLFVEGMEHYRPRAIRVSVPRGARIRALPDLGVPVDIRQTRRWSPDDVVDDGGVPRTRPPVAAVRGALWARSDKEAAYLLTTSVQQGLTTGEAVAHEMLRVRRDRRRLFLHAVILDLVGGVRSLGELEMAHECRRRGLPEPSRQVVRKARNGTYYLDVIWEEWSLVVEVDGIHHSWASQVVGDALRQNDISLQDALVLRVPLLGLRVAPDEFFAQIEQALVARGCPIRGSLSA